MPQKNPQYTRREKSECFQYSSSHRLSLPALNVPSWDFQGELKEATKKLRKIRTEDTDEHFSSRELLSDDTSKRNKLKTLDHHIDKTDLIKLKNSNLRQLKLLKKEEDHSFNRKEATGNIT